MIPKHKQVDKEMDSLNKSNTYSEEEQKVGTWINGKPLYKKSMMVTNLSYLVGEHNIDIGIPNVEMIFIGEGSFINGYNNKFIPINRYTGDALYNCWGSTTNTTLTLRCGQYNTANAYFWAIVTLYYTKTTD